MTSNTCAFTATSYLKTLAMLVDMTKQAIAAVKFVSLWFDGKLEAFQTSLHYVNLHTSIKM